MHKDYAMSLSNLGVLYQTMGDYKAAEPIFKLVLEIRKKIFGEKHHVYAMSLNNLGILYKQWVIKAASQFTSKY